MSLGYIGILIIFALFIFLLIFSPNLSCFGKKLKSPLYPLFRKRKERKLKTEDYGFSLKGGGTGPRAGEKAPRIKSESRGVSLRPDAQKKKLGKEKKLKIYDYGFSLGDKEDKDKSD